MKKQRIAMKNKSSVETFTPAVFCWLFLIALRSGKDNVFTWGILASKERRFWVGRDFNSYFYVLSAFWKAIEAYVSTFWPEFSVIDIDITCGFLLRCKGNKCSRGFWNEKRCLQFSYGIERLNIFTWIFKGKYKPRIGRLNTDDYIEGRPSRLLHRKWSE